MCLASHHGKTQYHAWKDVSSLKCFTYNAKPLYLGIINKKILKRTTDMLASIQSVDHADLQRRYIKCNEKLTVLIMKRSFMFSVCRSLPLVRSDCKGSGVYFVQAAGTPSGRFHRCKIVWTPDIHFPLFSSSKNSIH